MIGACGGNKRLVTSEACPVAESGRGLPHSKTSRSSHAARRLAADAKERSTVPSRILALRDLRPGEELTFDYGYDIEDYRDHPCRCGASGCCGYVVAEPLRDQVRALEAGTQRRK